MDEAQRMFVRDLSRDVIFRALAFDACFNDDSVEKKKEENHG